MIVNNIVLYNKISIELSARPRCQHILFLRGQGITKELYYD